MVTDITDQGCLILTFIFWPHFLAIIPVVAEVGGEGMISQKYSNTSSSENFHFLMIGQLATCFNDALKVWAVFKYAHTFTFCCRALLVFLAHAFKLPDGQRSLEFQPRFILLPLSATAKTWKQPKCPLIDEWIKKLWYNYSILFYSI